MSITKTIPQSECSNKTRTKRSVKHSSQGHSCKLVHLTDTDHHYNGEEKTFKQDRITLGRGDECNVKFPDCGTVSSLHAAIEWKNGEWTLVHLSKTNPTYLDNKVVELESLLKSGNTIRLSNGPEVVFYNKTNKLPSITGTTIILVHYKRMLLGMSLLLLFVVVAGLMWHYKKNNEESNPYWPAAKYIYEVNVPKKGIGKTVGTILI